MIPFFTNINWQLLILRFLLTGVTILLLLGFCVFVVILLQRWLRIKDEHKHKLRIVNEGNVSSYFRLIVESPEKALKFMFLMDSVPLGEVALPIKFVEDEQKKSQVPDQTNTPQAIIVAKPGTVASVGNKNNKPQTQPKDNEAVAAAENLNKTGKAVAEKSGALASLLGTIGSILPGSAGKTLKEQGDKARAVQSNTTKTMQMPDTAKTRVDAIQKDSSKLGVKETPKELPKNKSNKSATAKNVEEPQIHQTLPSDQTGNPADESVKKASMPATVKIGPYCVQTKVVEPGEEISLTLAISSKQRRLPEGGILYTVKSQQIPVEKLDAETPVITSQGVVWYKPVESWRYWLPYYLNGTMGIVTFLAIIYFLTLIWL